MQSIITKFAKILVLGGPKNALHGVTKLPLYLSFIILISGCTLSCHPFKDNRVPIKSTKKIDTTSPQFREILSIFIKQRYKTDMTLKEIQAELAYQEYLIEKKKRENESSSI